MSSYIVEGGKKLRGSIIVNPSKNAAVALLLASLLNKKKTLLKNVPKIEEVARVIEVLESIGVKVKWLDEKSVEINPPQKINIKKINAEAASKTRIVILLIGALMHKFKSFNLPVSGGCKLGKRTIAAHVYGLEEFGLKIEEKSDGILKIDRKKNTQPKEIILYESGDTATENLILAAAVGSGATTLKYASANYQVQDLCFFLTKLGVKIDGIGTTTITIHGQPEINTEVEYSIAEDPIEAMFFIALAAVTKSSILIKRCPIDFLELELLKLKKMNFKFKITSRYKAQNGYTDLVDIETKPSKLIAPIEKIYGRPYPGLNIDNVPFFAPIATQADGKTLIHDWVFENRAIYYTELNRLGAKVTLADPHRVFIEGPTPLTSVEMIAPPALRPSVTILLAMLAANGKSVLKNTYGIERGYENICERLSKLGAKIKKVED
jgi:UDP-N-acetylglucosamine 1-carboxyvinyltransferase